MVLPNLSLGYIFSCVQKAENPTGLSAFSFLDGA